MERRRTWIAVGIVVVLGWAAPVASDVIWPVAVPHVFVANQPARASQVNQNFDVLEEAVNDLNGRIELLESRTGEYVPAGTIAFFATAACPTGWSAYSAANGRYVVAAPSGGTVGGTVGATPMDDLEDRAHSHDIAHRHRWARYADSSRTWYSYPNATVGSAEVAVYDYDSSAGVSGGGSRRPLVLDSTTTLHTGDPTAATSGIAQTGELAPYIQLRACRKN